MKPRPLISLEHCSLVLDDHIILDDVSFELRAGERWALIGANGSGKTMLLKMIRGDVWPTPNGRERRTYRLAGESQAPAGSKQRIAYVGSERQDKYVRYDWNLSVTQIVTTGLFDEDIPLTKPSAAQRAKVERILRRFGVWSLRSRKFLTLSYGQRRLALVARAFVSDAPVLLLDEVFNGLDAKAKVKLRRALEAPRERHAWIITSHRAHELPANVTNVAHMQQGRLALGRPQIEHALRSVDVLAAGSTRRARALRQAQGERKEQSRTRAPRQPNSATSDSTSVRPEPVEGSLRARSAQQRAAEKSDRAPADSVRPEPVERSLQARRAQQSAAEKSDRTPAGTVRPEPVEGRDWLFKISNADIYRDYRLVIRGLNWTVRCGDHWAVLGANGSGKSTLLSLIHGDMHPALGGTIERQGAPIGTHIAEWKARVGWVSPELQADHYLAKSIEEIVISGRYASVGLNDPPTRADRTAAKQWLRYFAIEHLSERGPRQVSYGQMRLALIARAMVNDPELLLLDEPCTGLDGDVREHVLEVLQRIAAEGTQLIMAVHDTSDIVPAIRHTLRIGAKGRVTLEDRSSEGERPSRNRSGHERRD